MGILFLHNPKMIYGFRAAVRIIWWGLPWNAKRNASLLDRRILSTQNEERHFSWKLLKALHITNGDTTHDNKRKQPTNEWSWVAEVLPLGFRIHLKDLDKISAKGLWKVERLSVILKKNWFQQVMVTRRSNRSFYRFSEEIVVKLLVNWLF